MSKFLKGMVLLALATTILSGCSIGDAVQDVATQAVSDKVNVVNDAVQNGVNEAVGKVVDSAVDTTVGAIADGVNSVTSNSASATKVSGANMEWAFTKAGQHPEKLLIKAIGEAKSTLDVAIYSLTHPDIVQAILDAEQRGVAVRIISDEQQSGGEAQKKAIQRLHDAGIPIKIDNHSGLMHLKMTIVDGSIATIGSFNYSKAASTTNDEVIMIIHDAKVAESFTAEFKDMWSNTKQYVDFQ